jgi:hypothetical protein
VFVTGRSALGHWSIPLDLGPRSSTPDDELPNNRWRAIDAPGIVTPQRSKGMRGFVPRRFVWVGILFALLWSATPLVTSNANARPIGWDDVPDPNAPPNPKGDNDGVVVKAGAINRDRTSTGSSTVSTSRKSFWSLVTSYVRWARLAQGLRWYR